MIRRLEIAQSTLHRPHVLFLDEPTVGLDPMARDAVWEHLTELRTNYGTTIFLTTHYMDEAEALCDRIAIMHLGKVALGTCKELEPHWGTAATRWTRSSSATRAAALIPAALPRRTHRTRHGPAAW